MKLLLADDHTLFRDALVQYIERAEPGARVMLARDFPEALKVMNDWPDQDLVLLDLQMPGMNGLEGFRTMREAYPETPLALMSGVAEAEDVKAAMDLGAVGYFPKTLSGKALLKAIQLVLAGEKFLPLDQYTNAMMPAYYGEKTEKDDPFSDGRGDAGKASFNLTPREGDVLEFLIKGASNKEIANALGLQIVTVKLHVRGICRKLGAKNRTQAALIATKKSAAR
jgi:two-component system, NarL family, nitrate/nitrite response regulator NarL